MQFTCSKKQLADALTITSRAVKARSPLPVLQCIRLTATSSTYEVQLYATDYETAIETRVAANVEDPFEIALPAKQFCEIVNAMPGDEVRIKLTDAGNVTVQAKKSILRMAGVSPEDMVTLPPVNDDIGLILPEWMLYGIINKVSYATSKETTRPRLCGASFIVRENYVEMAATDSHVLSVYQQVFDGQMGRDLSVIIPRETLMELLKLLKASSEADVMVRVDDAQISFQIENRFTLTSRLIAGDYPQYKGFIPKNPTVHVTVDREAMAAAIKRMGIMARDDANRVYCEYSGSRLLLKSQAAGGSGEAEEELPISLEGGPFKGVLHAQQILDILSSFECEEVYIGWSDPLRPVIFTPLDSPDYYAVAMPMNPV